MMRSLLLASLLLVGCQSEPAKNSTQAVARLQPTQGNDVKGVVTFTAEKDGLHIVADVEGLKPGKHGFHIHEFGDCSAPDASSAGGHFNPTNQPHGGPGNPNSHLGDLGNLEADESGKAHYDRVDDRLTLNGDLSIIGKSVVIHRDEDDFVTQPTGNSGPRIACAAIVEE